MCICVYVCMYVRQQGRELWAKNSIDVSGKRNVATRDEEKELMQD